VVREEIVFSIDIENRRGQLQTFILTDAFTLADAEAVRVSPVFDTLAGHVVADTWTIEDWYFRHPLGVARASTADEESFARGEPSNLTPAQTPLWSIARFAAPPPPLPPPVYARQCHANAGALG
jgi:hypothetical protein